MSMAVKYSILCDMHCQPSCLIISDLGMVKSKLAVHFVQLYFESVKIY